ncbi:unnamed protein product [Polarella glacialis]|uniref:Protein kinase domain-containing protein n=1 Tax=Polarella glacialis TaxID=89957 RepID=A0A813LF68_POLGL|nr:unnamed protein product [Polarella glacialis]
MVSIWTVCLLLAQSYRASFFTGDDWRTAFPREETSAVMSEAGSVANASLLLIGFYVLLPIRCSSHVYILFILPTIYLALTLPLPSGTLEGGTTRRLQLTLRLFAIVALGFVGRAHLETLQRCEFLRTNRISRDLTKERVLRFKAEHEAEGGPLSTKPKSPQPPQSSARDGQSSYALSSMVFGLASPDKLETQLEVMHVIATSENWAIHDEEVVFFPGQKLGKGAFGAVFRGCYLHTSVAVKVFRSPTAVGRFYSLTDELRNMRCLRHPNIVSFFGACIIPEACEVVLVEELVDGPSLDRLLSGPRSCPSIGIRHHIMLGICSAMRYLFLQKPAIVHGDLKPSNVVVERGSFTPKLVDFGLSRRANSSSRALSGTLRWMAPEVVAETEGIPACSADIFSFGRIMFFVVTRRVPLEGLTRNQVVELAKEGIVPDLSWPEVIGPVQVDAERLSRGCMAAVPSVRPSAKDLLQELLRLSEGFRSFPADDSDAAGAMHQSPTCLKTCLAEFRQASQSEPCTCTATTYTSPADTAIAAEKLGNEAV